MHKQFFATALLVGAFGIMRAALGPNRPQGHKQTGKTGNPVIHCAVPNA
jgi:hypothetical protein